MIKTESCRTRFACTSCSSLAASRRCQEWHGRGRPAACERQSKEKGPGQPAGSAAAPRQRATHSRSTLPSASCGWHTLARNESGSGLRAAPRRTPTSRHTARVRGLSLGPTHGPLRAAFRGRSHVAVRRSGEMSRQRSRAAVSRMLRGGARSAAQAPRRAPPRSSQTHRPKSRPRFGGPPLLKADPGIPGIRRVRCRVCVSAEEPAHCGFLLFLKKRGRVALLERASGATRSAQSRVCVCVNPHPCACRAYICSALFF